MLTLPVADVVLFVPIIRSLITFLIVLLVLVVILKLLS